MQRLVQLKKRMRTIAEIQSVARTMATVASAKLSRTRVRAAGMRVYAGRVREILERQQVYLAHIGIPLVYVSPYFVERPIVRTRLLLHLSGDRGMCGSFNVAINRLALETTEAWRRDGVDVLLVTRGSKGASYLARRTGCELLDHSTWPRSGVTDELVDAAFRICTESFGTGSVDEVWCTYTRFFSPVEREPTLVRLLPIVPHAPTPEVGRISSAETERWSYEPGFSDVVLDVVRDFARLQFEDVLLESYASEQGARMITMEEATERASKRLHECRVQYNRVRREFITTDLIGALFASRVRRAVGRETREEVRAGG